MYTSRNSSRKPTQNLFRDTFYFLLHQKYTIVYNCKIFLFRNIKNHKNKEDQQEFERNVKERI